MSVFIYLFPGAYCAFDYLYPRNKISSRHIISLRIFPSVHIEGLAFGASRQESSDLNRSYITFRLYLNIFSFLAYIPQNSENVPRQPLKNSSPNTSASGYTMFPGLLTKIPLSGISVDTHYLNTIIIVKMNWNTS